MHLLQKAAAGALQQRANVTLRTTSHHCLHLQVQRCLSLLQAVLMSDGSQAPAGKGRGKKRRAEGSSTGRQAPGVDMSLPKE